jgi:dTDP-4-dehydrorhamnose reductase
MPRVMITGASGLLGVNLVSEWIGQSDLVAITWRNALRIPGLTTMSLDLRDPACIDALVAQRPDAIVHCAAWTDVDDCERDPRVARDVNVVAARHAALAAARADARLIHISTDAVFDGSVSFYGEHHPAHPVNVYGRAKLEGERAVYEACPSAVVVRTSIYGWNARAKRSLGEWVVGRLERREEVPGWTDVFFTPILVNDLAACLFRLLTLQVSGPLHIGGRERVSKYAFALAVARALELDANLVRPSTLAEADLPAKRPKDTSLDCALAVSLGIEIPSVAGGVDRFAKLQRSGHAARLKRVVDGSLGCQN